jgi:DNA primase
MRIVEFDQTLRAVAILGTGVNAEKIAEIQKKSTHVLIALDADATGQAFAMARKWGNAFDTCRVIVLSKDIKDSSDEELATLPL